MARNRFEAVLGEDRPVVEVPFDVPSVLGGKRVPVKGTVNGAPFRTTIAVYGGRYFLGFNKQIREAAGITPGDEVVVELERDEDPREVEIPSDLSHALLSAPNAKRAFDRLSYSHRKEYVTWIAEAKKSETRERRVVRTLEMLQKGIKHP